MQYIDKKNHITIITVTFNEELNLQKFFHNLRNFKNYFDIRIIIVDQSSTDNTVNIINSYWKAELYIHENKWYADPDKKWIFENCISDENERCFILDPDEEVSVDNVRELYNIVNNKENWYDIIKINIDSIIQDISIWKSYQPRIFKKKAVELTETIHNYIKPLSNKIYNSKYPLRNDDKKYHWKSIEILINKMNKYSSFETTHIQYNNKNQIIWWFLKWLFIWWLYIFIKQRMLFKWWKGIFLWFIIIFNHIITYAKFYEYYKNKQW